MIVHNGIRYWTTEELANSLAARDLISDGGSPATVRRRALRWADTEGLRPSATTKTGGLLWGEEETREAIAGADALSPLVC